MRRWTVFLLIAMGTTLTLATGVALAATVKCDGGWYCWGTDYGETLSGTSSDEFIYGLYGDDKIYGYRGADTLDGDKDQGDASLDGDDKVYGGPGDDTLYG